jgi:hypothetical protein
MMIKKTYNILCLKKKVCAIFLKCFPKDDEPFLKKRLFEKKDANMCCWGKKVAF